MAEFSQSMFLGENTLDRIEKQATNKQRNKPEQLSTPPPSTSGAANRRTTRSSQAVKRHSSDEQGLEVIEESPTNNATRFGGGGGDVTRQKSVRERLKTIGTQSRSSRSRKAFRRNKSDSVVSKVGVAGLQCSKARSESRDHLDMIDSELLKSDVCFNGLSGVPVEQVEAKGAQKTEINISKLLESDLSFEVPKLIGQHNGQRSPPDAKVSRRSDEFEDMFGNTDFSVDLHPRSQSLVNSYRDSKPYDNMFEQSAFTLEVPEEPKAAEPQMTSHFREAAEDEELREFSELQESLRVDPNDSDLQISSERLEIPLSIENVTFAHLPSVEGLELVQQEMDKFVSNRIEQSRSSMVQVPTKPQSGSLSKTLSMTQSHTFPSQIPFKPSTANTRPEPPSNGSMSLDSSKNLRLVSNWGLPDPIAKAYARKGITELFQWQADCLSNAKVILECANLVYSAPTSGGKTLVSEFLVAKAVVERKRKAIVILPFVAVAREKMFYLQEILSPAGIRVEGFFGGHNPPGGFDSVDVAVCTIEKANSIVNRLLEQRKLGDVGLLVVDEIHLISDSSRGYILELLLTKIRFASERLGERIQVVGMSATLPNMELLVEWLGAEQFRTDYRPIELKEMVKLGTCVFDNQKKLLRKLDPDPFQEIMRDQDNVAQLCLETILEGCSVIVFCPSKDRCEQLALHLAEFIYRTLKSGGNLGERLRQEINRDKLEEALGLLKNCPTGLDAVLGKTARYGCVYHHAGLTADERDIIESSFKSGNLRIIVATSTLSSGVNLPARRVIIRTPMFGGSVMNSLTYRQMIGRAGRKGRDILGESILMCDGQSSKAAWELVKTELKPIASCLDGDGYSHLKRAILEIIASGVASSTADLESFVNCTLFSCEKKCRFSFTIDSLEQNHRHVAWSKKRESDTNHGEGESIDPIASCVRFLLEYEFIRMQTNVESGETLLVSTPLGNACLSASMAPRDGFLLFSELQKSRQCFVLESELHAIYLVTPYSVSYQWQNISWVDFLERWENMDAAMRRVGELIGIRDAFLVKGLRGKIGEADHESLMTHKRFYTALALKRLVDEEPLSVVAQQFQCSRGLLQSLQQVASTFAGIVTAFCTSLNWNLLAMIITQFRERLFFGVQPDLLDLMRIASLNGQRARLLFNAGVTGLLELANSDPLKIEQILYNCMSFETEQQRKGEEEFETRRRLNQRNLYVTGRAGLTVQEAAHLLVTEARQYIQLEMGVRNPDWEENSGSKEANESLPMEKVDSENLFSPVQAVVQIETKETSASERRQQLPSVVSFEVSDLDSNREIEQLHNSLIMNFSHVLSDDKVPSQQLGGGKYDSLNVVDLCVDSSLFEKFAAILDQSDSVSVSFAISQFDRSKSVIGGNLLINQQVKTNQDEIVRNYPFLFDNFYLSGAAFTFPEAGGDDSENVVYYVNLRKSGAVKCDQKKSMLGRLLERENVTVDMYDAKEQLKVIYRSGLLSLEQEVIASLRDPKVACWLLQAEEKVIPLQAMVQQYCPELTTLCQMAGRCPGSTGPSSNYMSTIDAKIRCTVESFLVTHLIRAQITQFDQLDRTQEMLPTFVQREMPIHGALARMELVGFPADANKLAHLIERLKVAQERISERVRTLNGGRRLNFASTSEVAAALKVPRERNGRVKTCRQVLEKIDSPLATLVIAYRKIESNLSRTIEPLYRAIRDGKRIYGNSYCFTSTGRISMHEPNLQTVVKDFKVEIDPGHVEVFSCRSTFACSSPDRILLSADFCQLELCVLTHLSQDRKLLAVMNGGKDVFRGIAAKWNRIEDEALVSDELRNYTKAIVYGVIYGMGAKSMAAELNVDEDMACTLMEQFHSTYPEIRRYADKVIQVTRERGYIETLTGRRRYLPAIHSTDMKKRSEAERQAVCTTVQGSAADILKNAILRMMRNLRKYRQTLRLGQVELVLHMHDELIFEVPRDQSRKVAKILKSSMENCAKLSLPLRVKVKMGASWGEMQETQV
ncbi:AAEL005888-PA [Aedes aegypti]|uniref:DNA polymerase theta n=1 Tax=Aedes aegypti TaxID=7159 RepID=Q178I3_AEDAE|nr:AAEL005888-PA [Aedes aegypti]